ncbi:EAL domain-containing protein [Aestuariicella sp. G3-2]|uniref:EAL domain-containing protein n=1 Tax=Pseudomaricurvus albidus TaxID=2842452 RepID=UPI001C0E8913|nr:EAL domain-containing protein [Aestuariicella albida]MBU3069838.1 EAL domain-containing protein [Aestuariicella albida]
MGDSSFHEQASTDQLIQAASLVKEIPDFTIDEILDAIDKDQFYLVAQAQVDLESFELIGFELLARWEHEQYGDLLPYHFIPVLEESGQCYLFTIHIFKRMLSILDRLSHLEPGLHFSINISAHDLCSEQFAADIISAASQYQMDYDTIVLEVTETAGIFDDVSVTNLRKIKEFGIQLAVDDFWTGFSTLETIRLNLFSEIKIDYSLTSQLINDKTSMAGINAILQLSSDLGLRCIVEGIETCMARSVLLEAGACYGQGYLFNRGVRDNHIEEWITSYRRNRNYNPCANSSILLKQDELDSLEQRPHPSWIWDFEVNGIVWANSAALKFWVASSIDDLVQRDYTAMNYLAKTRLKSYQRRLKAGEEEISSEWDLFPGGEAKKVFCIQVPRTDPKTGHLIMLVNAFEGFHSRLPPRKFIESTNKFPVPFIIVDEDGKLIRINKHAHVELDIGTAETVANLMPQEAFDAIKARCENGVLVEKITEFTRVEGHDYLYLRAVMIPDRNEFGRHIFHIVAIPFQSF